jgi:hypothetical protein
VSNAQVTSVFTARETMVRTLKNIESSASRLDRTFGSLRGRVRSAFEFQVVARGVQLLENAIRGAVSAIPDLISRGEQWARTVDRVVDITGMAAEQASELAAVAENVGVNSDGLGRMMNALARTVATNGDALRDYGIRVRDNNGHLLDSYTVFQNVRRRIAEMGPSLQAAALAQTAFGRAALESADLLTLTNREWARQVQLARQSGLILTQQGLAAAEEWERTQSRLQQAITGIGAQILQGVAPALIGLTNGVTRTINANMGSIVRFVAGLVNFLATLAADLMGVQLNVTTEIGNAYDAAARRSDRLRDRIDEMTQANQRSTAGTRDNADAMARQRQETARLREEIGKAYRELYQTQQRTTYFGGMSNVEIELWRQRKMAEVKAAADRVKDAKKALAEHRKTMGQMEGVTAGAARRMRLDLQKTFGGGGVKGTIIEGLDQTLIDSRRFALRISDAIQDAIFGPDQQIQLGGGAPITIRSGGLIGTLQDVGRFLGEVGGYISRLNELLGGQAGLVAGVAGLALLVSKIPGVGAVTRGAGGGLSGLAGGFRGAIGGLFGASLINSLLREAGPQRGDEYGSFGMAGIDTLRAYLNAPMVVMKRIQQQILLATRGVLGTGSAGSDGGAARPPMSRPFGSMGWGFFGSSGGLNGDGTPSAAGFGLSNVWTLSLAAIFDRSRAGRSMIDDVPTQLGNIATSISSLAAAIGEGGSGGTGGGAGLTQVTQRVSTLEGQVNRGEESLLTSRIDTAFNRINDPASGLRAIRTASANRDRKLNEAIGDRVTWKRWNEVNAQVRTVNQGQKDSIDAHESRIDRLEERAGIGGPDSAATRRTASNSDQMVSLLRDIRRELRGGRAGAATSSLRASA